MKTRIPSVMHRKLERIPVCPENAAPGQLWMLKPNLSKNRRFGTKDEIIFPVVVLEVRDEDGPDDNHFVDVVHTHGLTGYRGQGDIQLDHTPFYYLMACSWHRQTLLTGFLDFCVLKTIPEDLLLDINSASLNSKPADYEPEARVQAFRKGLVDSTFHLTLELTDAIEYHEKTKAEIEEMSGSLEAILCSQREFAPVTAGGDFASSVKTAKLAMILKMERFLKKKLHGKRLQDVLKSLWTRRYLSTFEPEARIRIKELFSKRKGK